MTLLLYTLVSFVFTDDIYKHDTPERILANTKEKYIWLSTIPQAAPNIFGTLMTHEGVYYGHHLAVDCDHSQRPASYLK